MPWESARLYVAELEGLEEGGDAKVGEATKVAGGKDAKGEEETTVGQPTWVKGEDGEELLFLWDKTGYSLLYKWKLGGGQEPELMMEELKYDLSDPGESLFLIIAAQGTVDLLLPASSFPSRPFFGCFSCRLGLLPLPLHLPHSHSLRPHTPHQIPHDSSPPPPAFQEAHTSLLFNTSFRSLRQRRRSSSSLGHFFPLRWNDRLFSSRSFHPRRHLGRGCNRQKVERGG